MMNDLQILIHFISVLIGCKQKKNSNNFYGNLIVIVQDLKALLIFLGN